MIFSNTFYTNGKFHRQVLYRIAALTKLLENLQEVLQVYIKGTPPLIFYWEISKTFGGAVFLMSKLTKGASRIRTVLLEKVL